MRNIYITSNGLDTRLQNALNAYPQIIKVLKGKAVAVIPNAKLKSENRTTAQVALNELQKNSIAAAVFDLDEVKIEELKNFNAVYFCGGEPKYLMDAIYKNNWFERIRQFADNGNILIGQSAGAMNMHKRYCDTSTGKLLFQTNGFDYFPKMIVPHYSTLPASLKLQLPKDVFGINDTDLLIEI